MQRFPLILTCLLFITCLGFVHAAVDEKEAESLYQKAKKKTISLKWEEALVLFGDITDNHPGSRYEDDAQFWVGYCLEKRGGSDIEAFMAFSDLIKKYPESTRIRDAIVHQITLSENLVREGRQQFHEFLMDHLKSEDRMIRLQAAMALGRLGDKDAMNVLNEMADDPDWGPQVMDLSNKLATSGSADEKGSQQEPRRGVLDFRVEKEKQKKSDAPKSFKEKWDNALFFETKHHTHYRDMLKTDGRWSRDELVDFGMWTIMPTDPFSSYITLDDYDKKEWYRKYWKLQDPTPTTDDNEALDEFLRRIQFAEKRYGETWNYRQFEYLKDQYLRDGWPRAPWDARGELYVKYGEPNYITIGGYNKEEWLYDQFGIDFIVERYITNIYRNAIQPGPMAQAFYNDQLEWVESNYIIHPEFSYEHHYKKKPIKKIKLNVTKDSTKPGGTLLVTYTIPVKEFHFYKENGQHKIQYFRNLVVLDENMQEIRRFETLKEISKENKRALSKVKTVEESISLNLNPGQYRIALRIEDPKAEKLGIYIESIEVRQK
ncbi:HEAT repeat domain-containing protein [candidate division KSB1 bacterium]|nr:HEAT repeat domain-containing protein [candidate division KSB1 bacterium]